MNVFTNIGDTLDSLMQPDIPPSKQMHALVWNGVNDVQYQLTPAPTITDPRDILLRVHASSICGSDIHLVDGSMPSMKSGDILGHEFLGIVEEAGSEVRNIRVGQRVVVAFDIACGECAFCKREEFSGCKSTNSNPEIVALYGHKTAAIYGYSHLTGGIPGGQAEFVRVPFADVNCLVIPDQVPDDKALLLSDVVPTSYHAIQLGNVSRGDTVAIWGLGPIGLLVAMWCKLQGASRVVGIDCVPERLRKARDLAVDTINFNEHDVVRTLKEVFPEGIDVAIECAGGEYSKSITHRMERMLSLESDSADIFSEMFQSVRPFGRVVVIGVYTGYANHFPVGAMMEKSITVNGGQTPVQKYWKKLLQMIVDGTFDPSGVITHKCSLADGPQIYQKFINRQDGILKVIMSPEPVEERRRIE